MHYGETTQTEAKNTFVATVHGIRHVGVRQWHAQYTAPVTGLEFEQISDTVLEAYFNALPKPDDDQLAAFFGIAVVKSALQCSMSIFDLLKIDRLRASGYQYIAGDTLSALSEDACEKQVISRLLLARPHTPGLRQYITTHLQLMKRNFMLNRCRPAPMCAPALLLGSLRPEVQNYCIDNKLAPVLITANLYARKRIAADTLKDASQRIARFLESFLAGIQGRFAWLTSARFALMQEMLVQLFAASLRLFLRAILGMNDGSTAATLLTTHLGDSADRLCCAAWRYRGGMVTGFTHGTLVGNFDPIGCLIEATTVDRYVVNCNGEKQAAEYFLDRYPFALKKVQVTRVPNTPYADIVRTHWTTEPVRAVRTVMVVGFPMSRYNIMYKWYPGHHALAHLHLEIAMMKCLRTAGYRIIYKAHPDHAKDVCAMLADFADAIDDGRFEDVYRQADCLLFAHCNTTTFGFALLTGKPMVLLHVKSDPWYPRFQQLVQKRCCFVEAAIDEAGRITFDKQELPAAIATSPERVDFDVVRECVFTDSAA